MLFEETPAFSHHQEIVKHHLDKNRDAHAIILSQLAFIWLRWRALKML